ncbi:MAG: hypothetical protein FJ202_12130 [Gemmatimonadetes bacterium]|nr:hypothetical protein [Gemmatimonadota bacterium]
MTARSSRRGVALAAALGVMIVVGLAAGLAIESALAAARTSRAGADLTFGAAKVRRIADSVWGSAFDSSSLYAPAGTLIERRSVGGGADSSEVLIRAIGGRRAEVRVVVHAGAGGLRQIAGTAAIGTFVADTVTPGALRLAPVPGFGWVPVR